MKEVVLVISADSFCFLPNFLPVCPKGIVKQHCWLHKDTLETLSIVSVYLVVIVSFAGQ